MNIADIRRENLRALIKKHGSGKLSKMLGYRQPSFLSQLAGPKPNREVTEKTARRFEVELKLPTGTLDQPLPADGAASDAAMPAATHPDISLVANVIKLVGQIAAGEGVTLPPVKFSDVVALAYVDTMERGGVPRPEHITSIVRLLK